MIFDQFWSLLTYPYLISAVSYSSVRCICHRRGVILRLPWSYGPPFHTNNLNLVQNSSHHVSLNCSIIIWGPWRFYQDLFIVWRVPNSPIRKPAVSDRGIRTKLNRYTTIWPVICSCTISAWCHVPSDWSTPSQVNRPVDSGQHDHIMFLWSCYDSEWTLYPGLSTTRHDNS